jgi:ribosome maturation factor RimP
LLEEPSLSKKSSKKSRPLKKLSDSAAREQKIEQKTQPWQLQPLEAGLLPAPNTDSESSPISNPMNWQTSVERTVTALGYEVVDCERSSHGLLRVFIDRVPGQVYPGDEAGAEGAEFVTVDDCERVTRQLQYALEVDGCDYARLEVSSPGLDRPLKKPADFERFVDSQVDLTLKLVFQGRKKYRGTLRHAQDLSAGGGRFELVFQDGKEDKVLGFSLEEVREARLVPVLDFKGLRRKHDLGSQVGDEGAGNSEMSGGHEE